MKILVISSCSSTQKHGKLPNKLIPEDFRSTNRLRSRIKELSDYKTAAAEMYQGKEHKLLLEGIKGVRRHSQYGETTIGWHIISTGFGLIDENFEIVPYNVTNKESDILKDSRILKEDINEIINNFDTVFFLLGKEYVKALELLEHPLRVTGSAVQIFVTYKRNKGYSSLIPDNIPNCNVAEINADEIKNGYTAKGFVFKKLCEAACRDGFQVFEDVKNDPQRLIEIVLQDK